MPIVGIQGANQSCRPYGTGTKLLSHGMVVIFVENYKYSMGQLLETCGDSLTLIMISASEYILSPVSFSVSLELYCIQITHTSRIFNFLVGHLTYLFVNYRL